MWIKCTEWEELPVGMWLVRIEDEHEPFQVAYVTGSAKGYKLVVVGGRFSWDMPPLLEYRSIDETV